MVVALTALALYKPAASAIRTVIETALYYSYFRTHLTELETPLRDKDYYVGKGEIVEFHKMHSVEFKIRQEKRGLLNQLKGSYSALSAIVHGQLPGVWTSTTPLSKTVPNDKVRSEVVQRFVDSEEVVHKLFLCTLAPVFWDDFSADAKRALLKGLSGESKKALRLDER